MIAWLLVLWVELDDLCWASKCRDFNLGMRFGLKTVPFMVAYVNRISMMFNPLAK